MSVKFEKVSRFADVDLPLPSRSTANSAGYDFVVAEDVTLPPYEWYTMKMRDAVLSGKTDAKFGAEDYWGFVHPFDLEGISKVIKSLNCKIPLVSTGMKCKLENGQYLELSVRSSTPLKHWIICANSVGIIDADYYNNSANEGEIFFQLINLTPFTIQLKRGDRIGQGIIHTYHTTDDDAASGERAGGFGSTG